MILYILFIVLGIWLDQTYELPNMRERFMELTRYTEKKPKHGHTEETTDKTKN